MTANRPWVPGIVTEKQKMAIVGLEKAIQDIEEAEFSVFISPSASTIAIYDNDLTEGAVKKLEPIAFISTPHWEISPF